jgi:hypothetical protein
MAEKAESVFGGIRRLGWNGLSVVGVCWAVLTNAASWGEVCDEFDLEEYYIPGNDSYIRVIASKYHVRIDEARAGRRKSLDHVPGQARLA